ncbi:MAG: F0F1 ATP synthase subunit epsilon [Leptospira sp.]|jgi:F-type H+-transporting ATPase subunit epsilon|nr:F0F1 ATP synthase subunit epsilon [Leptospira sp.]
MRLKVFLPFRKLLELHNITKIIFESKSGSYGILPNRLDFTAAVVPGILYYEHKGKDHWIAIDEGVLIKTNDEILVSIRNAMEANSLEELQSVVEKEFLTLDKNDQSIRTSIAKLESDYVRRLKELHYG